MSTTNQNAPIESNQFQEGQEEMSPNEKAAQHTHAFPKKTVDPARKEMVNRPASVLASPEALVAYKQKFDDSFTVENYRGTNRKYPDGVVISVFTTKEEDGFDGVSKAFLLHELEKEAKFVDEIVSVFEPITAIDRGMVESMIVYASEMKKCRKYTRIEEDELNLLLEHALNQKAAANAFRELEANIIEELESFASVKKKEFDKAVHYGIMLDSSELKRRFGENAVGVTKYTLLSALGMEPEQLRGEYNYKGSDTQIKKYLLVWKDMGLLVKKSEHNRLNEMIKNLNVNGDRERFYIINSKKVYEALAELELEDRGVDNA